jgi:hypothetical protein
MLRALKRIVCLAMGIAAVEQASGFSVFGPVEAWQVPTLDYVTRAYYGDTELGGPKNFNEGSRLNTPIITYGYDYTFLTFFGTKGVAAIDAAMQELNALPGSSQISQAKLASYLMQGNQQINYTAQALVLTDLKSTVMSLMLEHMGLNGETHVYDLLSRNAEPAVTGQNCLFEYTVIDRNYDPVTWDPSAYVNGVQYSYVIWDGCQIAVQVADAVEATVDETSPAEYNFTAVATRQALRTGGYFLGFTYDDMGGLKYLYSKDNLALEAFEGTDIVTPEAGSGGEAGTTWAGLGDIGTNGTTTAVGATNNTYLVGGVEKIQYIKLNWDSLLGTGFVPKTYSYAVPWITNGALRSLRVTRTVTRPDIIFAAGNITGNNIGTAPIDYGIYPEGYNRTFNFVLNGFVPAGIDAVTAQVIAPEEIITFNNQTPAFENESPYFMDAPEGAGPFLQWGSFNGTTNAPEVYPDGSSIAALEEEILSGAGANSGSGASVTSGTWNPLTLVTTNTTTGTGTGTGTQ